MTEPSEPLWPQCTALTTSGTDWSGSQLAMRTWGTEGPQQVGCRGIKVSPFDECLAHLSKTDRAEYFGRLGAGANIDHSGTQISEQILKGLLAAVTDPETESARFGTVNFTEATFNIADFEGVEFAGEVSFFEAIFKRAVHFDSAAFGGDASFRRVLFSRGVSFGGARFTGQADFSGSKIEKATQFGPLFCAGDLDLTNMTFAVPVTIEASAVAVRCNRTRWESTATLRLRHARVELADAVLIRPVAVTSHPSEFGTPDEREPGQLGPSELGTPTVRVTSLRGVDAAHLVLTDIDLSDCEFAGVFHLDQLRIEGNCIFRFPPQGVRRRWIWPERWSRRRTVLEEHHWRALPAASGNPHPGWTGRPATAPSRSSQPADLAATYRGLRKTFEDTKNEPDAADFYYGEMEMRRHDSARSLGERRLLWAYWLLSGYGLRAMRAMGWLAFAMAATVFTLLFWGLPAHPRVQPITGTLDSGSDVRLSTRAPVPGGAAPGPWSDKLSKRRVDRALRTAVNSAVFRSAGQGLTVPGTYIEMTSRLVEPVLLVMVILAVRGRVKR
ncbi:pentapeptide repeat-containing protein [Streptomyces luteogriseus]|uniref:pentapeptide repeat-containing protein n=1 Tax=Streptomyces luteogriseus TaxID=68233 RepID=UPI0033CB2092